MTGHSRRARRALSHLPEVDPALAALALWCTHRDGDATLTKGDTITYGPEFTALALHEQVGLLGHHVLHVALRHSARMAAMAGRVQGFDPALFNTVADALVNDTILAAGHGMPRPCVTLADLLGGQPQVADWDVARLYHHLAGGTDRHAGDKPQCERDVLPDPSAGEQDASAADWRARLERAQAIGRAAGRGIGAVFGILGDLPAPHVEWERHLRGLIATALHDTPRQSHSRPARAWIASEAAARHAKAPTPPFQPAIIRRTLRPRLVLGLDTSGSVDDGLLRRLAGEIAGITARAGAEVHLMAFDETVSGAVQLDPETIARHLAALPLRREGGTDFVDLLARADALRPAMVVVFTDLGGAFGAPPRCPVLWVAPRRAGSVPPFGRVVHLDDIGTDSHRNLRTGGQAAWQ